MSVNLNTEENINLGTKLLGWQFPANQNLIRGKVWWVTAIILILVLEIYAIVTLNYLFAVIVIISAAIVWLDSRKEPEWLDFAIHQPGVTIGQRLWNWKELDHFWIAYHPPTVTSLYIQPKSAFNPRLSVPLVNINPLKVREVLTKFLSENLEREDEPTSEALARMLKIQ